MPRPATSVATITRILPSRKPSRALMRLCCGTSPDICTALMPSRVRRSSMRRTSSLRLANTITRIQSFWVIRLYSSLYLSLPATA
ncbi:hypothetical protein D3C75_1084950 [compost metagenome]